MKRPMCSSAIRASCPTCFRASRVSCPMCFCPARALVPYMPLVPHALHASCANLNLSALVFSCIII